MSKSILIKKPNVKSLYTDQDIIDITLSEVDPIYFIENFVMVQHPMKGKVPLVLYPFQVDMINAYHKNRFVVAMTARQMGKCVTADTSIKVGDSNMEIGNLVRNKVSLKTRLVMKLEKLLLGTI